MKSVRIGVVGVGNFGRLHARTLAGLAEADLVALVDGRAERMAQLTKELPGVKGYADIGTALRESGASPQTSSCQSAAPVMSELKARICSTG